MVRLNLQLFAYTGNSIVDYLKSEGKDSSFNARKDIAKSLGISNYTGTASQNTKILNTLRSGSGSTNTTTTKNNNSNKNTNTTPTPTPTSTPTTSNPTTPTFTGVDQSLVDDAYTPFTSSAEAEGYKTQRDEYAQSLENKINSGYQMSDSVKQAFEWLNGQAEYFKNGKTSWDDKILGQIGKIENREEFVYDVDKDTLFQQALASAMGSGKSAMQDTIGQASSLTGGYGSTYATSAGNQAYNAFIEDAYNNLPEYYNMALQAYQAEGEEMYNLLGVYAQMGEQEWNKNVDAYNLISDSANSQRNWEYGLYQDDITNTYNAMNMYDSFYQQKNTEDLELWKQNISNAWNGITLENTNYWNQTELDYKKDRDAIADQQWQDTYDFNKDQANIAQSNWEKEYQLELASNNAKVDETTGDIIVDKTATKKAPSESQMKKALEAYNKDMQAGDADLTNYNQYIDSLTDVDEAAINEYIASYGVLPYEERTYTKTKNTMNGFLWTRNIGDNGIDPDDEVTDQYGNVYKIKDLNVSDEIKKELTNLKKGSSYTK